MDVVPLPIRVSRAEQILPDRAQRTAAASQLSPDRAAVPVGPSWVGSTDVISEWVVCLCLPTVVSEHSTSGTFDGEHGAGDGCGDKHHDRHRGAQGDLCGVEDGQQAR